MIISIGAAGCAPDTTSRDGWTTWDECDRWIRPAAVLRLEIAAAARDLVATSVGPLVLEDQQPNRRREGRDNAESDGRVHAQSSVAQTTNAKVTMLSTVTTTRINER